MKTEEYVKILEITEAMGFILNGRVDGSLQFIHKTDDSIRFYWMKTATFEQNISQAVNVVQRIAVKKKVEEIMRY